MAQHHFQKLKLDTNAHPKPAKSSLSSLHQNFSDDVRAQSRGVPLPREHSASKLPVEELEAETPQVQSHVGSLGDIEDNDGIQERDFGDLSDLGDLGSTSELSSVEASLRNRRTVISFDTKVTLDNGVRLRISQPLPRSESWLGPVNGSESEASDNEAARFRVHSDTEMSRYDPVTGRPLDRRKDISDAFYRTGEMRHPLLQSTVDELAKDQHLDVNNHNKISSLIHSATDTELADGLMSPLNDYLLSPSALSPIPFSPGRACGTWSTRRSDSTRSRSYRSEKSSFGSVGRPNRRRSIRSDASMSPAASFLRQWSVRDEASPPPEPDSEGQEIGHTGWIIGRQIGYGGFSVVKEVFTMEGSKRVVRAVKIVRKQVPGKDDFENDRIQNEFEHEVEIWKYLRHKYILPLLSVYVADFATYCITQLNTGGTLYDLVRARRKLPEGERGLPSHLAKRYIYQLGSAIRYLHEDMKVVHRDIKLENCLLDMSHPNAQEVGGNILLCDFGMAGFIHDDGRASPGIETTQDALMRNIGPSATSTSVVGSLHYAAPELIDAPASIFSTAADMWAYGVVMHALFTSLLPFNHAFEPRLVATIIKGDWDDAPLFNCPAVRDQPGAEYAVELVKGCIEVDVDVRWQASQALESPWFAGCRELYEPVEHGEEKQNGWL